MRLRKFEDHLYEKLRDPEYAVEYLVAASDDGIEEFLQALREIACAQEGGIKRVAEQAGLGRESIYKSLSKQGNPHIKTLGSILGAMGMRFCVTRSGASHTLLSSSSSRGTK